MKLVKECAILAMSHDERATIIGHLAVIWGHLEDHFRAIGDATSVMEAERLMDAMSAVEGLHRVLKSDDLDIKRGNPVLGVDCGM